MSWDFSGDATAVQRALDEAKLDADEVSLTASGNVLGVATEGFDAWAWLDEEVQRALAGVAIDSGARREAAARRGTVARRRDPGIGGRSVASGRSRRAGAKLLKKERRRPCQRFFTAHERSLASMVGAQSAESGC